MFNIPLNRVQSENDNISGEISPEYLLAQWQAGLTLDFKTLYDIATTSVHEERSINFFERKKNKLL